MKILDLIDGLAVRINIAFGGMVRKKDPAKKKCYFCGEMRANHGGTGHEFREFT